jgi:hypothetical protein
LEIRAAIHSTSNKQRTLDRSSMRHSFLVLSLWTQYRRAVAAGDAKCVTKTTGRFS